MDLLGGTCVAATALVLWTVWRRPRPERVAEEMIAAALAGRPEPFAAAERFTDPRDRAAALFLASRRLDFEERPDLALGALRDAAALDPDRYAEHLLAEARTPEDLAGAEVAALALLKRRPALDSLRALCAQHLAATDRAEEALALLDRGGALEPELRLARAHVLAGLGQERDALRIADELVLALQGGDTGLAGRAASLADTLRQGLLGAEAVVIAAGRQGRLAHAAVNYRLLADSLLAASGRIATTLELQPLDADLARARRLAAAQDPRAAVFEGIHRLREGKIEVARAVFAEAFERDPTSFPAARGLGAAMALLESRAWAAAQRLDPLPLPPGTDRFLPDLGALTDTERRVVAVSLHPLRAALPLLVERGVTLRILPIDVRPTDLADLAAFEHARAEDGRAIRAVGGLATPKLGVSRIEDLLDTTSEHGWVFAHEAAHLAFFHLPEPWPARVAALRERALATPWAATQYAMSNDDELFAVAYEDWLRYVYERPQAQLSDEAGVVDDLRRLFTELAARERL